MATSRKPTSSSESGFTLVEVVLAISILSAMVVINYNVIMSMVETKVEVDDRREGVFVANSVLTRLTRELQLAKKTPQLPPPCDGSSATTPGAFIGDGGAQGGSGPTLTFSTTQGAQYIPDGGDHSGPVQITYRVAKDPDQKDEKNATLLLIREETPNRKPYAQSCKDTIRFPITNRLVNLQFKYFDKENNLWADEWNGARSRKLPDIIQFTISLKSERGHVETYTSAVALPAS
jgi:prepilin-type N-terminal cleavage/methylation domain-containing protein